MALTAEAPRLLVRRARPEEYSTAGELTVAAYRQLLGDELGPAYVLELADVARRDAACSVLVALDGERLLGAVTYVPGPDNPYAEFRLFCRSRGSNDTLVT